MDLPQVPFALSAIVILLLALFVRHYQNSRLRVLEYIIRSLKARQQWHKSIMEIRRRVRERRLQARLQAQTTLRLVEHARLDAYEEAESARWEAEIAGAAARPNEEVGPLACGYGGYEVSSPFLLGIHVDHSIKSKLVKEADSYQMSNLKDEANATNALLSA